MRLIRQGTVFWLYFLAVLAWMFLYLLLNNRADWDLWGVMSFGAILDQNAGRFPYEDVFSYTAYGLPWIYHEWGSGVIFFQVFKHFGSAGLFWLKICLVTGIFLLACRRMTFPNADEKPLTGWQAGIFHCTLLICAYLILPICSTTIRCQLFTFFCYALFLLVLERVRYRQRTRVLWLLPPLMLFWVNVHGGFVTGLVAMAVYWLAFLIDGRRSETVRLGLSLLLSLGMVLVNPYGLAFVSTMFAAWSLPRDTISEWGNVFTLDIPFYGVLYTMLLLAGLGMGLWQWRQSREKFPYVLVLLGLTGINGWLHYKLTPLFLITLLSLGFNRRIFGESGNEKTLPVLYPVYAWLVPIILVLLALIPAGMYTREQTHPFLVRVPGAETMKQGRKLSKFAYPVGLVAFMKEQGIVGNLWAPFAWGEYLYWALYPGVLVSIDGRYETIYPEQVYRDTRAFYTPPYNLRNADKYETTHILVPATEAGLLKRMDMRPDWHLIYRDSMSALYARKPVLRAPKTYPENSAFLDEYPAEDDRFRLPAIRDH